LVWGEMGKTGGVPKLSQRFSWAPSTKKKIIEIKNKL